MIGANRRDNCLDLKNSEAYLPNHCYQSTVFVASSPVHIVLVFFVVLAYFQIVVFHFKYFFEFEYIIMGLDQLF